MIAIFKESGKSFIQLTKRNTKVLLSSYFFSLICFGFMLTNYTLCIDEETWIHNTDINGINLWLTQGRFGIYLFDKIFMPTGSYIPFIWDFLAITVWFLAGVILLYCITLFYNSYSQFSVFAFCTMFTSVPLVVGELLSFSMFNLQQAIAMLLVSLSVCCTFLFFKSGVKRLLFISAFFLFVSTSFFQAFPTVYISAIVLYAVLCLIQEPSAGSKRILRSIAFSIGVFAAGVGLYYIVNRFITTAFVPSGASYLDTYYVGWGKNNGFFTPMLKAFRNIALVLFGRGVEGGITLLLITLFFTVFTIYWVCNKKTVKNKVLTFIFLAFLILSPFSLSIATAMPGIVGRTYLALPFLCGAVVFLVLNIPYKRKILYISICAIVCFMLVENAVSMNAYFYKSYKSYQEDKAFSQNVMQRINNEGVDYRQKEIVFIGAYKEGNEVEDWDPASGSFFNWDGGNIGRMINFLNTEGYSVKYPQSDHLQQAYSASKKMPSWPSQGCIQQIESYLVVKLSDVSDDSVWFQLNGVNK